MKKLVSILLVGSALFLCLGFGKKVAVKRPIVVHATDPVFSIDLPSNRSTGYGWFLEKHDDEVQAAHYDYLRTMKDAKPGMVGTPGVSRWTFHVKHSAFKVPSLLHMTLIYRRAFDQARTKEQTFTIITQP